MFFIRKTKKEKGERERTKEINKKKFVLQRSSSLQIRTVFFSKRFLHSYHVTLELLDAKSLFVSPSGETGFRTGRIFRQKEL